MVSAAGCLLLYVFRLGRFRFESPKISNQNNSMIVGTSEAFCRVKTAASTVSPVAFTISPASLSGNPETPEATIIILF